MKILFFFGLCYRDEWAYLILMPTARSPAHEKFFLAHLPGAHDNCFLPMTNAQEYKAQAHIRCPQ